MFVVVTSDKEVWAVYTKTSRLVFSLTEISDLSAMCFLPSSNAEENCVAFAIYDVKTGCSSLRIFDLQSMSDCFEKASAFSGRVSSLTNIEPSLVPGTWALAFGLENGAVGIFTFNDTQDETTLFGDVNSFEHCQCPVSTRQRLALFSCAILHFFLGN